MVRVSLELTRDEAGATYIVRRPKRFDRRALIADFGDMGRVSLRTVPDPKKPCGPLGSGLVVFRGAIRFDGESVFSRVRDERPIGFTQGFGCGGQRDRLSAAPRRDRNPILSSCSEDGRTGFFAAKETESGPAAFLAARFERTPDLFIARTIFVEGANRNLKLTDGATAAKVRPPEPFYGRGELADGRLTGRLRIGLPGAGLVELAPADAELVPRRSFRPTCFPFGLAREAGNDNAERFARALR